jgi:murein DD-endopeptidase MepM/ murein hydrolase activator NlpD
VAGPIIDQFRPPATPYGPGNRGLDYHTTPGEPVRAAGPGTVIFAGPVAGRLAVVVLHPDNLRTSYVGLARIDVQRGQTVDGGQPVAHAIDRLQFGVRAGTAYLDPAVLLAGGRTIARLVPDR